MTVIRGQGMFVLGLANSRNEVPREGRGGAQK